MSNAYPASVRPRWTQRPLAQEVRRRQDSGEPSTPSSADLNAFRRGDRTLLAMLYRRHAPSIYRFVRERVGCAADAGDLTQEVFLAGFGDRTRCQYLGTSPFQSFFIGIARNLLLHHFRRARVHQARTEVLARTELDSEPAAPSPDREAEHQEAAALLDGFLRQLSDGDRAFFRFHLVERPPRRITAMRLDMTEDQVRYKEGKLRVRVASYLKRIGYLEVAGADLKVAAHKARTDAASFGGSPPTLPGAAVACGPPRWAPAWHPAVVPATAAAP